MVSAESELNSLSSCFQSVVHDLKASNSSIELVCNRALKLANQLNATISCLVGFADAVQVIGDTASKWATRDIGTSLTRYCLRQRALENEIKALSTALIENFSRPLEKKSSEWKQNLIDIERRHQKNLKKTRSKKQQMTNDIVAEHRSGCTELLLEQRNQYSTFANLLLPVINAQICLLEEGSHIKAVKETIEQSISTENPQDIINTVIEDVCHTGDSSWRKRIASPTRASKTRNSCNDSNSSPSTSSVALSLNQNDNNSIYYGTISSVGSSRPQTLSNPGDFGKRAAISSQTFVPPLGTPFLQNSPSTEFAKPPLPRRYNDGPVYGNGSQNSASLAGSIHSVSSNDVSNPIQQRPLSFNGNEVQLDGNKQVETNTLSEQISNMVDKFNDEIHLMCDQSLPFDNNGMNTVRRLGSEPSNIPASVSLSQRLSVDAIRRPEFIRPPPPLPPERRNSTISAATPNAPSVYDLRNAGMFGGPNAMNGRVRSINDLNQDVYNTGGVVYRAPFSNSVDASNYVTHQQDSLPDPPLNSARSSYNRPPPPAYNNYNTQF